MSDGSGLVNKKNKNTCSNQHTEIFNGFVKELTPQGIAPCISLQLGVVRFMNVG
jgi:hypothetical protein